MQITRHNKQLVKVAGSINLLFLLLCIALVIFLGYGHSEKQEIVGKAATFILANSVCWIVNLCILILLVPLLSKWRYSRWLSFYQVLSDEPGGEGLRYPVIGPIIFVIGIDTLSLVAIELILSRYAQTAI